jgi:hypothetical protein
MLSRSAIGTTRFVAPARTSTTTSPTRRTTKTPDEFPSPTKDLEIHETVGVLEESYCALEIAEALQGPLGSSVDIYQELAFAFSGLSMAIRVVGHFIFNSRCLYLLPRLSRSCSFIYPAVPSLAVRMTGRRGSLARAFPFLFPRSPPSNLLSTISIAVDFDVCMENAKGLR